MEAEKNLKIRHEKIKQYAISNEPCGDYILSLHRLLKK